MKIQFKNPFRKKKEEPVINKPATQYYDRTEIDETGATYRMIIGQRSNGKSFSILKTMIENYLTKGERSAYIRRYEEEIRPKNIQLLFSQEILLNLIKELSGGKYNSTFYRSNCFYMAYYDEEENAFTSRDQVPFCITRAVNTWETSKGQDAGEIHLICFDEFMTREGYLRDEFNLVEHPEMLGAEVLICGSLEKYFGVAGIKSPTSITLLSEVGPSNVVNVKDLPYAEAYYYEADNVYEFMLYDIDEAAEELLYPIVIMGVNAKSKTAINGTYEVLSAMYAIGVNANDEFEGVMSDGVGTLTIKNVDSEGNYSFVGSFVGEDGKTYKLNTVANVYAMDGDTEEEIELKEETETPPTPPTPPVDGAIVFDADVDKGNAGTDSNNATAYQITKNGVTVEVTSGILGVYNNENHYRIYKNQTLTVTSTVGNIAKVEFTCTANDAEKYGPGCFTVTDGEYNYSGVVGTWTGDAATVTFTASTNQVRATQIVVTLAGTTDVENVVVGQTPTKIIQSGQVLIIRGENIYNILGTQVK